MFDLTKEEYEQIVEKCMLKNDARELDKILEMRIKGYTRIQMAMKLNVSIETIDKRMKILKKKIQKTL